MAKRRATKSRRGRAGGKRAPARRGAAGAKARGARAARPDRGAALAAFARKIVKATSDPSYPFTELYAEDCTSTEATGQTYAGRGGIEEKLKGWEQMQEGTSWKARNVWTDPRKGTICIEWEAEVKLRGGPTVKLVEVAVHEVRGGKIVAERYYYNPAAMAPPSAGATA